LPWSSDSFVVISTFLPSPSFADVHRHSTGTGISIEFPGCLQHLMLRSGLLEIFYMEVFFVVPVGYGDFCPLWGCWLSIVVMHAPSSTVPLILVLFSEEIPCRTSTYFNSPSSLLVECAASPLPQPICSTQRNMQKLSFAL